MSARQSVWFKDHPSPLHSRVTTYMLAATFFLGGGGVGGWGALEWQGILQLSPCSLNTAQREREKGGGGGATPL